MNPDSALVCHLTKHVGSSHSTETQVFGDEIGLSHMLFEDSHILLGHGMRDLSKRTSQLVVGWI